MSDERIAEMVNGYPYPKVIHPAKEANREPKYIEQLFTEARQTKWAAGSAAYRLPGQTFQGYMPEEAFQECLDLYNILEEMEKAYGVNLAIHKGMASHIAGMMKQLHGKIQRGTLGVEDNTIHVYS